MRTSIDGLLNDLGVVTFITLCWGSIGKESLTPWGAPPKWHSACEIGISGEVFPPCFLL
jgi:hypothetical protein